MAENRRTAVLAIHKIIEKEMDEFPKWPECKITDVLRKSEGGERDAHRQMGKSGLRKKVKNEMALFVIQGRRKGHTSMITPGTNIKTASPWNDFRLEFSDIDMLCRSAASHTSGGFG